MFRTGRTLAVAAAAALLSVVGFAGAADAATPSAAAAAAPGAVSPRAACAFYDGRALTVYGDHGPRVSQVQCLLANRKYLPWSGVDGKFGRTTLAAVKKFQAKSHLAATGRVDTRTWAALYH
ncbi:MULTISPECIES: peptidoglycan-binding domain-containing protein [Kitasatospora]|uniref:Peptidoglycan binding-like domain-containing protein n=1 Tax=Kitasatospora cystarginea TaxID=58350 RepID=A0ABN3E7T0_9ACTN